MDDSGELEAEKELGNIVFTKPFAYQEINEEKVEVKCGTGILAVITLSSFTAKAKKKK